LSGPLFIESTERERWKDL